MINIYSAVNNAVCIEVWRSFLLSTVVQNNISYTTDVDVTVAETSVCSMYHFSSSNATSIRVLQRTKCLLFTGWTWIFCPQMFSVMCSVTMLGTFVYILLVLREHRLVFAFIHVLPNSYITVVELFCFCLLICANFVDNP